MSTSMVLSVVLLMALCSLSGALRPIILISGLFGDDTELASVKKFVLSKHPDADITTVTKFHGLNSFTNMWKQVEETYDLIRPVLDSSPEGVTLICYSQGGLVCRGIIQTYPDHNVHTFISVASPQMGQFGIPDRLVPILPDREDMYLIAYNPLGQELLSLASYWNDPFHQLLYRLSSEFLAVINDVKNQHADFKPVKQLVLVGGESDGVIVPWQSSFFGFYPENDVSKVIPMLEQQVYEDDVFGLQTLHATGKIHSCIMSEVYHTKWLHIEDVYTTCIYAWLD